MYNSCWWCVLWGDSSFWTSSRSYYLMIVNSLNSFLSVTVSSLNSQRSMIDLLVPTLVNQFLLITPHVSHVWLLHILTLFQWILSLLQLHPLLSLVLYSWPNHTHCSVDIFFVFPIMIHHDQSIIISLTVTVSDLLYERILLLLSL